MNSTRLPRPAPSRGFALARALRPLLLCALLAGAATPIEARPETLQTVGGLRQPTVAVFSPEGDALYVLNAAHGDVGAIPGESFVSKLRVAPEGRAAMAELRFVEGLTAPVGAAVSPTRIGPAPAGSLWVALGSPFVEGERGSLIKDASEVFIGLAAYDPETGETLARLPLGPSAPARPKENQPLLSPACLVFDSRGNAYLGDAGIGNHLFPDAPAGRAGFWRIGPQTLAALLEGRREGGADFLPISSIPSCLDYDAERDALYIGVNQRVGKPTGSVVRIERGEFRGLQGMSTVSREIPTISGIRIRPSGEALLTSKDGELLEPRGRKRVRSLRFRPKLTLASPGAFDLRPLPDGRLLLAIPEKNSRAAGGGQHLRLVALD